MTVQEELEIRQAMPQDTAAVSAILVEAAQWIEAIGTPMWKAGELTSERIAADVAHGLFFLAMRGGEPVGTLKFELSDQRFWPDQPDGDSAFVHRLAVARRAAGTGVSTALLAWAKARAIALGRRYLRLDTEASRTRLRAVYERFGFHYHSDWQYGPYLVARYEIALERSGVSSAQPRDAGAT